MRVIIVGGRKKTRHLVRAFLSKGMQVTVINDDIEICRNLARDVNATVVHGDGTKPFILEDADVKHAYMVIALTPKDADNLVICQLAKNVYNVSRTFATVNDPNYIPVFTQLGVDTVVSTAEVIASLIEQRAVEEELASLVPIEEGRISLMKVFISKDSPICSKSVAEAGFPNKIIVGCVIRGNEILIPRGDTVILTGDQLIILAMPQVQIETLRMIAGRSDV